MEKEKIIFPFKCPVCGKSEFSNYDWLLKEDKNMEIYEYDSFTNESRLLDAIEARFVHCEFCGWIYDLKQVLSNDVIGDRNKKTVNELKEEYFIKIKENPNYNYDEEESKPEAHKCPICEEYTFKDACSYDVCPICGWEDDGTEDTPFDDYSDANCISIKEAKEEFKKKRLENPNYKWKKCKK